MKKYSSPVFSSSRLIMALAALVLVSGCASSGTNAKAPPVSAVKGDSMSPQYQSQVISKAMERALDQAEASGNTQEALALLSQLHDRHPDDAKIAARYAKALREDEQIKTATRVLAPFSKGKKKDGDAITENAMAHLTLGDFSKAEDLALDAIEMDEKNARAYLALGTAQDALGKHQDAEISFRQGIKFWRGNPAPILNNLALNLASQGHLEESLSLIEKAQKEAPGNIELERNRRIITTLMETTSVPKTPTPGKKPES